MNNGWVRMGVVALNKSVYVAMSPDRRDLIFGPHGLTDIQGAAEIRVQESDHVPEPGEFIKATRGSHILVTGQGCPTLTEEILDAMPTLELIAHSGGSVRSFVTPELLHRGIAVTSAARGVARGVAELALAFSLALLRSIYTADRAFRSTGGWELARSTGQGREFSSQQVGVIGASRTGREFVGICSALGARTSVCDPYLSDAEAAVLGVQQLDLDDLLRESDLISLHAPATEQTHHLIGARELSLLHDGALLVNTARASLIHTPSLIAELRRGRISAAMDVFDVEPVPLTDELLRIDNVLVTPHIGGMTQDGRLRQGRIVIDQVNRWIAGEPLTEAVTADRFSILA
jgi:phosphoglycerate dehydrogenase-like enzyme